MVAPPHSLYTQSWAPRRQRHGTVNVDGFGVGWHTPERAEPVRYRRAQPIWTDASFASLAPTVRPTCVLAAVRSATPGTAADESAAAPFTEGRWLFSHNGRLHDWDRARAGLREAAADVPDSRAGVDSALLFGLAVAAWRRGAGLGEGLAQASSGAAEHGGGRVTLLATDGTRLAGLVSDGEPLWLRQTSNGVMVASEPDDGDGDGWSEVAEGTVVVATADDVTTSNL